MLRTTSDLSCLKALSTKDGRSKPLRHGLLRVPEQVKQCARVYVALASVQVARSTSGRHILIAADLHYAIQLLGVESGVKSEISCHGEDRRRVEVEVDILLRASGDRLALRSKRCTGVDLSQGDTMRLDGCTNVLDLQPCGKRIVEVYCHMRNVIAVTGGRENCRLASAPDDNHTRRRLTL